MPKFQSDIYIFVKKTTAVIQDIIVVYKFAPENEFSAKMKKIEETRAHFIAVASSLFRKFGFDKTSMDEIARIAHKAKRSLYYHFPGKEDLFKAVIEQELETIRQKLQVIFDKTEDLPLERIKNYIQCRMQLISEAGIYQQILLYDVQNDIDQRLTPFGTIRHSFYEWERLNVLKLIQDDTAANISDCTCDYEAIADMLQMILQSFDISFFVQGNYHKYEQTFLSMTNLIVDSLKIQIMQNKNYQTAAETNIIS